MVLTVQALSWMFSDGKGFPSSLRGCTVTYVGNSM